MDERNEVVNSNDFQNMQPQASFNADAGKKVSPYADSPYLSYFEQNGSPDLDEPPVKKPKDEKPKRSVHKIARRILSAFLVVLLVVGCCGVTAFVLNRHWEKKYDLLNDVTANKLNVLEERIKAISKSSSASASVSQGALTPAQIYSQTVDSVVSVLTDISGGSGFVISENGYVVSNYHVVEGASMLQVVTYDGQIYDAELIGYDETNDVSLMKIEAEGLSCVTFGSSDDLVVGDQVVAVGNALGELAATLTVGYVSGKDRIVSTDGSAINMLQTDAAINSGNSGGPLFNMNGEVIGITTAKYTGESASGAIIEGIGFAIPIDDVLGMIEDLQEYGYITGAFLGVMVRDVEATVIQNYGFPAGAYVDSVEKGYCAERAGIQPMDIIVNLGGYEVRSVSELSRALRKFEAGDITTVTVFRSGAEVNLTITFDEKPQDTPQTTPQPSQPPAQETQPESGDPWWYEYFLPFFGQG